jgi:hypothetical protein
MQGRKGAEHSMQQMKSFVTGITSVAKNMSRVKYRKDIHLLLHTAKM